MESNTNIEMEEENGENGDTVQFKRKDGVEKDGYLCFPIDLKPEEVDVEEKQEEHYDYDMTTCQEDPRFQQQNKTNWCYRMYVDYHACRNLLGENAQQCKYFYKCYTSICPHAWVEKWDDERERGNFPCDPTRGCPNLNYKCNEQKPCP